MKCPKQQSCPKCGSNEWDHANVGLIGAIVCTNCGEIYMMKEEITMTNEEFETKFDKHELDAEYAMFISEQYDAWTKGKMLSYWDDPEVYAEFKAYMLDTIPVNSMLGSNPLDLFPTIWGKPQ